MRAYLSRIISPFIAALATALVGFGILREGDIGAFVDAGVTIIDLLVFGIFYGVGHRLIDRKANPSDAAKPDSVPLSPPARTL